MGARARNADTVIAASAVLAALAMLLLGWQIIQALPRINLAIASRGAELSYPLVLLVGVTVCAGVCALLWALFYSRRAGQRAESRLQWMTHRLPGAFYVFSLGPNDVAAFALMTSNAGSMLGVAPQEVMRDANVARRLIEPEDRERLKIALAHSRAALSALEADFRIRTPDGEVRWLRTLAVPVKESDGTIQWNGHLLNITAIRATEQALRDATQRLEDAQSVARFGDWTCDLATGALTWSPQVFQLLGREPMLGPPSLAELIDMLLEGPEPTTSAFELAQSSGEPQSFEASARLPSGSVVALNVIVLPVSDGAGTVTGMRGTIQDITDRKALELRLSLAKEVADAASLAKSAFLATMSHEIRTPLNGMLGLLELIRLKPADPEIRTALETVKDSGQSLQRIIDDILDFSKVEAGKLAIRPEATSLVDVVDSVHRIYAGSASSLGLELQRHVDPDISPTLMLDAWRLRQILSNFVSNALKFTPKGTVDIRVLLLAREGDFERIRFEVADTGIGISIAEQQNLFQSFEQAQGIASRFGGTGLGLSISRSLAELMDGQVSMSSELGVGTTMTLDIAAFIADPALATAAETDQDSSPAEPVDVSSHSTHATDPNMLILVVDDHPTNRMVMHSQINALGYAAESVESGAEALEHWRSGRFALVLTDCNMPSMSGYDLSRRIREAEAGSVRRRTPVIACSANAIHGVIQDCLDAGMDDYIAKPISLKILSEKLTRWLPPPVQRVATIAPLPQQPVTPAEIRSTATPAWEKRREFENNVPGVTQRAFAHFRKVNDVDVLQLLEAIDRGELGTVTRMAHRIKGACGFIGATGLASVCGMIEQAGREDDGPGVEWLMDSFHIELEQLNAALDA